MYFAVFVLTLLTMILLCSRATLLRRMDSTGCQHRETSGPNQQPPASNIDASGIQAPLPSHAPRRSARRRSRCRCCGRSRKKGGACRRCHRHRR